jgi:hypothetical protein
MTRSQFYLTAAGAALAFSLIGPPAMAAMNDFVGVWNNKLQSTRGIPYVTFRRNGDQLMIHAYGACHPRACDWGEVAVQPFVPSVDTPVEGANAFIAEFDKRAEKTMLIGQLTDAGVLNIRAFTLWQDGSNRSDYWKIDYFSK